MEKKLLVLGVVFGFIVLSSGCAAKNKAVVKNEMTVGMSAIIPAQPQAAQQAAQTQAPAPMAAVNTQTDPFVWDFGQVNAGQIMKHEFPLKNEGKFLPLTIKDVNTSCGCTVSDVKKKVLKPGESTVIAVSFNSTGYNGPVEQFIYVHTDNTENPVLKFSIKASVVK